MIQLQSRWWHGKTLSNHTNSVITGKNGQHLTDDSATRLKNECATNDPSVIFWYIPFQDDDTERSVEMCSLQMLLLQNADASDKVLLSGETNPIQIRRFGNYFWNWNSSGEVGGELFLDLDVSPRSV